MAQAKNGQKNLLLKKIFLSVAEKKKPVVAK